MRTIAPSRVLGFSTSEILAEPDGARAQARLARNLGYRLARPNLRELREIRADLAALRDSEEMVGREKVRGLLTALIEVTAAFDAEYEVLLGKRALAHAAKSKPLHASLLAALQAHPSRPTDLSASLKKDPAQLSRALSELRLAGWVVELERQPAQDHRERWYALSPEGLRVVAALAAEPAQAEPAELRPPATTEKESPRTTIRAVDIRTIKTRVATRGIVRHSPSQEVAAEASAAAPREAVAEDTPGGSL